VVASVKPQRPIRSFVRREGRMTEAQKRALSELWPRYGIDDDQAPLDFVSLFGRRAPVILEIGFGSGETLATLAAAHPENDYLGIEVHRPGVGRLLQRLDAEGIANARVVVADAKEVIERRIADDSLDAVLIYFPDPWPKKRHHKRRLVQSEFVALLRRKLRRGATLRLATDWRDYAEHMMAVLSAAEGFENVAGHGGYAERGERPLTKFERRGERLGHGVWDLAFRRA
jgi:tRNA (guanine-N7-)-methyltransferase